MIPVTALNARTVTVPRLGGPVFFTPGRLETLLDLLGEFDEDGLVDSGDPRVDYEWNTRVMGTSTSYTPQGPVDPFLVPSNYDEAAENDEVMDVINGDCEAAVDLALRYLVTGDTDAADAVVAILTAWSVLDEWDVSAGTAQTPLTWSNKWPVFLQAAMMIRDYAGYTTDLHDDLVAVTTGGLAISRTYKSANNVAAWGCAHDFAAAMFLEDQDLFDKTLRRWRSLFDAAVQRNVPVNEIYRQEGGTGDGRTGLWYSNFFLYGMTVAAEWARFGGAWLYDYTGPDGSTFQGLALQIRRWTRFPWDYPYNSSGTLSQTVRNLPHDDILHALWPDSDSQWILDNFPAGSSRDNFGMRQAVLAYRGRPLYE